MPIGVKFCVMVQPYHFPIHAILHEEDCELFIRIRIRSCVPEVSYFAFGGDIFWGLQMRIYLYAAVNMNF